MGPAEGAHLAWRPQRARMKRLRSPAAPAPKQACSNADGNSVRQGGTAAANAAAQLKLLSPPTSCTTFRERMKCHPARHDLSHPTSAPVGQGSIYPQKKMGGREGRGL